VAKKDYTKALRVIILFGIVSLLGDIIYEGARSINGQYLQTLGASAAIVGLIAGFGEFLGYGLRFLSGYFSDKTKAYWFFTILGYGLLASIPLLAFTGLWQVAALFIIIERIGKAIRNPARDTLLSHSAKTVGTGWGFAVHEFLDQIGALLGPLMIALIFLNLGSNAQSVKDYQYVYSVLWIPYMLLMGVLFLTYFISKDSRKFEAVEKRKVERLSATYWYYLAFTFLTTLGFINFVIFGYHFKARNILSDSQIPLFYAAAMMVDAVFALFIGRLYDAIKRKRKNEAAGLLLLIIIPVLTALIPILVFLQNVYLIFLGIILWGAVMGAHETIMRAAIADITPLSKRGTGYGIFTAVYGFSALLSGIAAGVLYDYGIYPLIAFVVAVQVCSVLVFLLIKNKLENFLIINKTII
jgi:MFS family permease